MHFSVRMLKKLVSAIVRVLPHGAKDVLGRTQLYLFFRNTYCHITLVDTDPDSGCGLFIKLYRKAGEHRLTRLMDWQIPSRTRHVLLRNLEHLIRRANNCLISRAIRVVSCGKPIREEEFFRVLRGSEILSRII